MGSNVDLDEIAKFERMAHEWWDPAGKFRTLHEINPARVGYIKEILTGSAQGDLAGINLLDIGCGGGILAEAMADNGANVVGIDRSEKIIGIATAHQAESGSSASYRMQSAAELAEAQPASFDVVLAMEVLEHVPDMTAFLGDCANLLKPGGTLFFATLNRTPKSWLFAIMGAEYLLRWLPRGTHQFEKFVKPSELRTALQSNGLEMQAVRGLSYNPINATWRLSDDTQVNYLGHALKPQQA
ncbi:3-demethylubiquinone-9 3-methyltransferase [Magnetococcus marinus MC-1]|uniref:Ubiquinone biosynthesis O-methyltransferase n=1 Tax=Magnetococcus marinus (strain ATCC BAA-1437 / JCM 17883 / MC-1) TaxID=156889 RepID=A0L9I8_MAGMM|nr:3-demethylubiquinone-9 3-methyltransferase [Magnetococcus marinus MC-1]